MLHSQGDAFEGSCPKRDNVRNVWRAPFRTIKPLHLALFNICYVLHHFGGCCPPNDSVRNVWRAVVRAVSASLVAPVLGYSLVGASPGVFWAQAMSMLLC